MAGQKKRSIDGRLARPSKKQKRQQQYNSDDSADEDQGFDPVNLLDSDDDVLDAKVDDVGGDDSSVSGSGSEDNARSKTSKAKLKMKLPKKVSAKAAKNDADDDDEDEVDDEEDEEEDSELDIGDDEFDIEGEEKKVKKRNDPSAFATSLSKILSTKLSTSKRSDPVLARSAEAHESSKAAIDSALEAKAKRQLRDQKRKAMEKGRVRDVLQTSQTEVFDGEPDMTTSDILALEAKLRKTAQRGVVKMFNAVRAAQVQSAEAEKKTRKDGVIGMGRRDEKVNEMTKKGFLDLIAGGGLKKGTIEEA